MSTTTETKSMDRLPVYIYVLKQDKDRFFGWLNNNIASADGNYSHQKIASLLGYHTEYTSFTPDQLEDFLSFVKSEGFGHRLVYATKHSHSGSQGLHIRIGE